jgi:hypothetical protein
MKKLIVITACLLLVPATASAQDDSFRYIGQGYVFYGVGTGTGGTSQYAGAGAVLFLHKGLAFEVEPAWARLGQYHINTLVGSTDFSYHFRRRARRGQMDPFVALGYTAFVPNGGGFYDSGGNISVGVNIWMRLHTALRLEVRHYVNARTSGLGEPHDTAFRVGVTFR